MSLGELLLIAFVALLVFGPKQLPMLARHLGQFLAQMTRYKQQASHLWQQQLLQQQLQDNRRKAEHADVSYLKKDNETTKIVK